MATTTTSNLSTGQSALGIYYDTVVFESLQPYLYFEQFGVVEIVPQGNYTSRFYNFDQIATSSVTQITTEGTAPTAIAVSVTTSNITPTQYGVSVEMTDLVALTAVFDLINTTLKEVGKAVARRIDTVIQTVVNAGTNALFAGGKSNRVSLGPGDLIDVGLIIRGAQTLRKNAAPEFPSGGYVAIAHPSVIYDLMSNTSSGQWIDINKYAAPEKIFKGEIGSLGGVRIVQSANVQTFSSTVTVYPTTLIAYEAYKVAYWLPRKINTYVNPPESSVAPNNQLGQLGWVGAKVNMGVARINESKLVRIESAGTSL